MAKILVTGATGQLGQELALLAGDHQDHFFTFVNREQLLLENSESIKNYFSKRQFDVVVNCAAYTAVDKAETEKDLAYAVNAAAVGQLASICREQKMNLIHFSTDYVFNGNATSPLQPDQETDPVNYYGFTKREGEKLALENNGAHTVIIRTSWVYSQFGKNFVKTMMRLMNEKDEINVVADQVGSPTYAADLAAATLKIIDSNNFEPGIFHYSNKGIISWFEFAKAIQEITNSACKVNAIDSAQFPTPAARPFYSAMDTSSIEKAYGLEIPPYRDSLEKCLDILMNKKPVTPQ